MKTCTFFLAIMLALFSVSSQDLIIFRDIDSGEIRAKVQAVKANHIAYTPYDQQSLKPIKIPKYKVEVIIYEDGMKQYFAAEDYQPDTLIFSSPGSNLNTIQGQEFYSKGKEDAKIYYKGNGPLWGTLLPAAIPGYGVIAGAISGGIIAAVRPNVDPYQLPNPQYYIKNEEYALGYEKQVMRKKLGKVLTGYGLGIAVQTVALIIIINSW